MAEVDAICKEGKELEAPHRGLLLQLVQLRGRGPGRVSSRLTYPAEVKIIRVPCSCRVNPLFILRAFQRGADGVITLRLPPGRLPLHQRATTTPAAA